ncbi:signaling lymphocytic activation molecule-like isoform X2 [Bufo gargarizans]|uniref:signaling lymphocytic activation molecule-like isoform X2 n=1 Tax=Bufo gargarizans TaxID=30331 RepID=UPI001CF26CA2|nr:signaling lymphocytic activation molecule-like isoform X2 [Bufo gargarizans]
MSALFRLLYVIAVCHIGESHLCDQVIQLNGSLGKPLVLYQLRMMPEYQTLSLTTTNKTTKIPFLVYDLIENQIMYPKANISDSRYQFKRDSSSVIIPKLQKDDEKKYELSVQRKDFFSLVCEIELKVYEQISNLTVSVTEDSRNDTCNVTMECLMKTGDDVTFIWMKDNKTLSHNGSTLEISIATDNANSIFRCTATNPVSEGWSEHTLSSACNPNNDNGFPDIMFYILGSSLPILVTMVAIIVIVIVIIKKKRKRDIYSKRCVNPPSIPESRPPVPEPASEQRPEGIQTVYAIVQKPKNQSISSDASKSLPFSSVYELAGPCRNNIQVQNSTDEIWV